jgi:PAS domain S-box-containing protein/putative nucleotidyltransferase with HDIG domain
MATPLRVLVIEDSEADAELLGLTLKRGGFAPVMKRVDSAKGVSRSLKEERWDIIICDYSLPGFSGFEALEIYKASGADIPFILLSGVVGEDIAAEAMIRGAHDYVMKDRKARLIPAIERELREAVLRREKQESESRFRLMFETMSLGGLYQDAAGRITSANRAAERILGLSHDELISGTPRDPRWKFVNEDGSEVPAASQPAQVVLRTGQPVFNKILGIFHPDEERFYWLVVSSIPQFRPGEDKPFEVFTTLVDITASKDAEAALRHSEERYRRIYEEGPLGMSTAGEDFRFLTANRAFSQMLGYSVEELSLLTFMDITHPDHIAGDKASILALLRDEIPVYRTEKRYVHKDGRVVWGALTVTAIRDKDGRFLYFLAMIVDITQERQAEESLRESERRYRSLADSLPTAVYEADLAGRLTYVNRAAFEWFGYSIEDDVEGRGALDMLVEADRLRAGGNFRRILSDGSASSGEYTALRKDGSTFPVMVTSSPITHDGRPDGLRGILVDISERKRAENELTKSSNLLRAVVDSTPDWIFVKDTDHRYVMVNKSYARALNLEPLDLIGREDMEFWPKELCLDDPSRGIKGWHSDDLAVLSGATIHNPDNTAVLADGTARDFDTFKIPLQGPSGEVYGVLGYSRDVTERKKYEETMRKSLERAEKVLRSTVQALETVIEYRDPYTAGHQEKVTTLACALAEEIGLSSEKVDNIRFGGLLHDLGKIYVPAEILSKPGKLTEFEFGILKTHPQVGYDILKNIDFPIEVTAMVAQHHERIDGSGYPRGLKGDEICIEAKCLAVADVVEAMSSHRPYRPALGIDAALDEIAKKKGIYYDEAVAEACLWLFKQKGFRFPIKKEPAPPQVKDQP